MLTLKQRQLLEYIARQINATGIAPTHDQMCENFGLSSKSSSSRLVTQLVERGYIARLPNRARAIELTDKARDALPHMCGKRKSRNKYGAIKTNVDGITFDSKGEARRYGVLKALEDKGEISDLKCHPSFVLTVNGVRIQRYTTDFSYKNTETGKVVVEDYKSAPTAKKLDFRRTLKLMRAVLGIEVHVVTKPNAEIGGAV